MTFLKDCLKNTGPVVHEAAAPQAGQDLGPDESARKAAHVAGDRRLLRNQIYAGIADVPEYGVRGRRGEFEPLVSEELFYRVQVILSGRALPTAPRQRAHPDFPLRAFVR